MSDKIIVVGDEDAKRKKIMAVGENDAQPMLEILKLYINDLLIIKYSFEDELLRIKGRPPIHEAAISESKKFGFNAPGDDMIPKEIARMKMIGGLIGSFPELWNDFSHGNGCFMEMDNLFKEIEIIFEDIHIIISSNQESSKLLSVPFPELKKVQLAVFQASSDYGDARDQVQKLLND
jgi:hypothetical protein